MAYEDGILVDPEIGKPKKKKRADKPKGYRIVPVIGGMYRAVNQAGGKVPASLQGSWTSKTELLERINKES